MATKHHSPEQAIGLLRQAEVALAGGQDVAQVCPTLGVSQQTYYRWRTADGGVRTDQAKRLEDLERGNARLERLVAEAERDKAVLREAAAGSCWARRSGRRPSSGCGPRSAGASPRNAGHAACRARPARPSGGRPTSPTTSRPSSAG